MIGCVFILRIGELNRMTFCFASYWREFLYRKETIYLNFLRVTVWGWCGVYFRSIQNRIHVNFLTDFHEKYIKNIVPKKKTSIVK